MVADGDTLLFTAISDNLRPMTCVSHDNGLTHSNWLEHNPADEQVASIQIATSAGGAYLFWTDAISNTSRSKFSSDAGLTWNSSFSSPSANCLAVNALDHVVVATSIVLIEEVPTVQARWSFNGGQQWGQLQTVESVLTAVSGNSISFTQNHTLLTEYDLHPDIDRRIRLAHGTRTGTPWTRFNELPNQPYGHVVRSLSLASDTLSDNIVLVSVWEEGESWANPATVFSTRSRDAGQTWDAPQRLAVGTPISWSSYDQITIFCRQNLYGLAWSNDTVENIDERGIYFRMSANHGQYWYPCQKIDSTWLNTMFTTGQFVGDEVRVYWPARQDSEQSGETFRAITGILTTDTILPTIQDASEIPWSVSPDTTIELRIDANDNDSLWQVQFIALRQNASDDSVVINMERVAAEQYENEWTVSADSVIWYCYFRVEDLWENVAVTSIDTLYVGVSSGSELKPTAVEDFSLSAFPNPFNSILSISLEVPLYQDVTLGLYDLLGREVDVVYRGRLSSSTISYVAPAALASGVYFLRASAGDVSVLGKVVLLK